MRRSLILGGCSAVSSRKMSSSSGLRTSRSIEVGVGARLPEIGAQQIPAGRSVSMLSSAQRASIETRALSGSARLAGGRFGQTDHGSPAGLSPAPPSGPARRSSPARRIADAVGEVLGLIHVVGGEKDVLPSALRPSIIFPSIAAGARIEGRCRLIEKDQVGIAKRSRRRHRRGVSAPRERADAGLSLWRSGRRARPSLPPSAWPLIRSSRTAQSPR